MGVSNFPISVDPDEAETLRLVETKAPYPAGMAVSTRRAQ